MATSLRAALLVFSIVGSLYAGTLSAAQQSPHRSSASAIDIQAQSEQVIVRDIQWYRKYYGRPFFIGEIENVGPDPVQDVHVNVILYDADGTILTTKRGYSLLDLVPAGERAPFYIYFSDDPGAFDHYDYTVHARTAAAYVRAGRHQQFDVTRQHIIAENEEYFALAGETRNERDEAARFVEAVVTAYDVEGNVVGVANEFVEQNVVLPGEVAAFYVPMDVTDLVAGYTIQVEGHVEEDTTRQTRELTVQRLDLSINALEQGVVTGDVVNRADHPVSAIHVTVTASDDAGTLVAVGSTTPITNVVAPGGRHPFEIYFWEQDIPTGVHLVAHAEAELTETASMSSEEQPAQSASDPEHSPTFEWDTSLNRPLLATVLFVLGLIASFVSRYLFVGDQT